MEKIAYGELNLKPWEFERLTVGELDALFEGYMRRVDREEDMLIRRVSLPVYQSMLGKHAPTYEQLTAYRRKNKAPGKMDPALAEKWRKIFNVEIPRIKKGAGHNSS